MAKLSTVALLALLGLLLLTAVVRADDDDADVIPAAAGEVAEDTEGAEEEESEESDEEGETGGINTKAIFLTPRDKFPAGEKIETLIAFENGGDTSLNILYAMAHITSPSDHNQFVQNFTGNMYSRAVSPGETGNFKYVFEPHYSLEPYDYNLVIRVFFANENNDTFAATAYNATISVSDKLGIDSETVMTFVTIFGILAAAGYYFASKKKSSRPRSRPTAAVNKVEMGSKGSFEADFVSKDHIAYAESLANKSNSPKRSTSKGGKN